MGAGHRAPVEFQGCHRCTHSQTHPATVTPHRVSAAHGGGELGQLSLDAEQPLKARALLEVAGEYYPESVEAHELLSDLCLSLGDDGRALHI